MQYFKVKTVIFVSIAFHIKVSDRAGREVCPIFVYSISLILDTLGLRQSYTISFRFVPASRYRAVFWQLLHSSNISSVIIIKRKRKSAQAV